MVEKQEKLNKIPSQKIVELSKILCHRIEEEIGLLEDNLWCDLFDAIEKILKDKS